MSHTPGKWNVAGFVVYGTRKVRDLEQPGQPVRNESICRITAKDNEDEDRANAQLIAAAPDLLAACEYMLNLTSANWTPPYSDGEAKGLELMLAAIGKARGKQP